MNACMYVHPKPRMFEKAKLEKAAQVLYLKMMGCGLLGARRCNCTKLFGCVLGILRIDSKCIQLRATGN